MQALFQNYYYSSGCCIISKLISSCLFIIYLIVHVAENYIAINAVKSILLVSTEQKYTLWAGASLFFSRSILRH